MLRGSHQAKIDEKGRLKLPTSFRADIEAMWKTPAVYLTCDDAAGAVRPHLSDARLGRHRRNAC